MRVRLLTYNVRSLRDDRAALVRVIRAADADVVCVQEAPRFARSRPRCAALAADTGLLYLTGGRSAAGLLLLARTGLRVFSTRDLLLSKAPRLHQRGLAVAVVSQRGSVPFVVASMHLDLDATERLRHAREVLCQLGASSRGCVLAGDVNETADGSAWRLLAAALPECGVVGATVRGGRRLDAVFTDPSMCIVSAAVMTGADVEAASDHRPVLVELDVPAAGADTGR